MSLLRVLCEALLDDKYVDKREVYVHGNDFATAAVLAGRVYRGLRANTVNACKYNKRTTHRPTGINNTSTSIADTTMSPLAIASPSEREQTLARRADPPRGRQTNYKSNGF